MRRIFVLLLVLGQNVEQNKIHSTYNKGKNKKKRCFGFKLKRIEVQKGEFSTSLIK